MLNNSLHVPKALALLALAMTPLAPGAAAEVMAQGRPLSAGFAQTVLVIETSAYGCERFEVYVALDAAQQQRGLMFVMEMPDDVGMIFVHPYERALSMWMKNTFIPLDMLFVDRAGRIVHIAEHTTPHSLGTISSNRPAAAVLEINAGLAGRLGIGIGDRIRHELFAPEAE